MISVHINGIKQIPGIDFVAGDNTLSFSSPPQARDIIQVTSPYGSVANVYGDGSTFLFHMVLDIQKHTDIMNLLNDVGKYYENPAVADVLERLRVVVELVKNDDINCR